VGNKSATFLTETWHENTDSLALRRATPPGYQTIDAARPITSDVAVHAVDFQNRGGLAFVFRDTAYSLPRHLRDPSHTDAVLFGRLLKTFLFSEY